MPTDRDSEIADALLAISPVDGRYRRHMHPLARYFSEFALIEYRVRIEIEWYLSLAANPAIDAVAMLDAGIQAALRKIYGDFSITEAIRIKTWEAAINHDVKAVEYYLKDYFKEHHPDLPVEFIHFGCTSEDINNLAYALILKEFVEHWLRPELEKLIVALGGLARRHSAMPMLARTHGQAATPTTVGKELAVFAARLERQLERLARQEYLGKFNGAVGNFNAHQVAYPEAGWIEHSRRFVESLGLTWNPLTTQIESHDFIAELLGTAALICTILLGLSRDMWGYISLGYFVQRPRANEVGSSTMPHKINPIDFENCEGNAGLGIALFQHLAAKLPVSRWQRDLSDSTALRSLGTAFGHMAIALKSLQAGLSKSEINPERIAVDLAESQAWEVLAEAIQTVMRRNGLQRPYETLKELTRGRAIDRELIREFIEKLPLNDEAKAALSELTPERYVGLASQLVKRFAPRGSQ